MKYDVVITEILKRVITVDGVSMRDAEENATELYDRESIVLDADDFESVSIKVLATCPKCGNMYSGRPAISREDNCTEICPSCGVREALEAAGLSGKLQNEILTEVNNLHK